MLLLFTFGLHDRGWSPWWTAVGLLPVSLPLTLSAPFAGRLIARVGAPRLIVCGALAAVAGYGCRLAALPGAGYAAGYLPALLLVGAAFVLSFSALNAQAVAAVPPEERAAAVPLYQTGVQAGAVLMLCLTAVVRTAFTSERPAWALLTAVGALGLAVALTGLRPPIRRRKESGS